MQKKREIFVLLGILSICYFGYALWNWLFFLTMGFGYKIESIYRFQVFINSDRYLDAVPAFTDWYPDAVPAIGLFIVALTILIWAIKKNLRRCFYSMSWAVLVIGCLFLYDITNQNWQAYELVPQGHAKFHYANWPFFTGRLSNHRWGFIDKNGDFVVKPKFKTLSDFSEGYAVASLEWGQQGYIDRMGTFAIEPQFWSAYDFSNGFAVFREPDGKYGLIDKKGNIILDATYDELSSYADGLLPAKILSKYGYINLSGEIIIEPVFERASSFSEGLAAVHLDNEWGYIDTTGKFKIEPQYQEAGNYSGDLASVRVDNKMGLIDKTGSFVIDPKFDAVSEPYNGLRWLMENISYTQVDANGKVLRQTDDYQIANHIANNREGMTLDYNKKKGLVGYLDEEGNVSIPHRYINASNFTEGLAAVSINKLAMPRWIAYLIVFSSGILLYKKYLTRDS